MVNQAASGVSSDVTGLPYRLISIYISETLEGTIF
jgi:hypothetical protein